MRKMSLLSVIGIGGVGALQAQDQDAAVWADSVVTPQFFIAVIAGVLLALGFQFILTILSVALGITAIGDVREKYVESKHSRDKESDDDSHDMSTGTKITGAFGIWSVITVGISLFGATALAINLSLITSPVISITLGLVVWATFFILLFYLESRVVNTLVGGLINTATAGLRASGSAVKEMFSTSKEQQLKNVAEDTVDKIRRDFQASFDPHVIDETIDEFFDRLNKNVPDYQQLKSDVEEIVEKSSEKKKEALQQSQQQKSGGGQGKWMAIQSVLSSAISQSSGSKDDEDKKEQLKQLQRELKEAYGEGNTDQEKLEKVVSRLTPAEEEKVHSYIEKIKQTFSDATPEDMEKGRLKERIKEIIKDPQVEANKIAGKMKEIDRNTIVSFLSKNTALDRAQVEKFANKAEEALRSVQNELSGGDSGVDQSELKEKLEKLLSRFMNGSEKTNFNFSHLTSLFQDKLNNPKESLDVVKRKVSNVDRDSLVAVVTNNTKIDQKDIDKVVDSIEEARNNVLQKIEEIENEAHRRVENMKRKAVIQAEHTRKVAAAAAWWLVVSAVLSAGTAIAGSLVAMG